MVGLGAGTAMSRRKQPRPQQLNPGILPDAQAEGNEVKRFRMDETRVCNKCCAEFFDEDEFLDHERNCTKSQQVVVMKEADDGGGEMPEEYSHGSPDGPPSDHDDGQSSGHSLSNVNAESVERLEEEEEEEEETKSPTEESGQRERAELPASPGRRCQSSTKLQDSNVTLESMSATRVAVTQHSSNRMSPLSPQDVQQAIPLILEQLVCLQQQQLQQIQLTEQIRIQVAMMAPQGLRSAMGAAVDPLKALGAHLSQQLSAAAALIGKRTGSQSLSIETMKQGRLPQPSALPSPLAGGRGAMAAKSDMMKGIPELVSRLPALLPQTPVAMAFSGAFSSFQPGVDPSKKPKSKMPTSLPPDSSKNGESVYRHKCKYCGKSFGNDSALQIHLRSHTGERPFKCNICGNRFTTKGNLKVHFQRHRDKYPHIRMNPHPVPEHLDNVPTSSGIPYGMSMPIEESNQIDPPKPTLDIKPTLGHPPPGFHPLALPVFKPAPFEGFGSDLFTHRPSPSTSDATSVSSNMFVHEMGSDRQHQDSKEQLMGTLHHMNGSVLLPGEQHSSGTAKLQQMVDGLEKRTSDPNECVICHRVLSCQSSLKMHYRTHTGERPYKCKICGRAFSTKGNLKAHYGVHRANTPLKMQHSCPICQKKFTNAVVLQQHIRMHMGGQIPNTPVAETPNEAAEAMDSSLPDDKSMDGTGFDDSMEDHEADLDSHEKSGDGPDSDQPLTSQEPQHQGPPPLSAFSSLDVLKNLTSALALRRQSSTASESEGTPKEYPSAPREPEYPSAPREPEYPSAPREPEYPSAPREPEYPSAPREPEYPSAPREPEYPSAAREPEYQNGHSPGISDSAMSFHSSSPVHHHMGNNPSKSPESAMHEDYSRNGSAMHEDFSRNGSAMHQDYSRNGSAMHQDFNRNGSAMHQDFNRNGSAMHQDFNRNGSATHQDFNRNGSATHEDFNRTGSATHEDFNRTGSATHQDFSRNLSRQESDCGTQEDGNESSGALDLTAPSSFVTKQIKEEPDLPFTNGEYAPSHLPFLRMPSSSLSGLEMKTSLSSLEMKIPSENPLSPHGLFGSQMPQGTGMSSSPNSAGPPRRSSKQHLCNVCGKNFSSASALQIHERTHTGEKPFACTICGRAFTTKGNLKVHVGTHMWNNASRRGQRLSLDNPMALMAMSAEAKMIPEMMQPPKELAPPPPPMNFNPSLWNQYAAAFSNGLSMKANEISVIQSGGIPLPGSLAGGPLVGSTGGLMMKMDGSHSGLPSAMAELEKNRSDMVPKSQFPHFMEEGKIAVN